MEQKALVNKIQEQLKVLKPQQEQALANLNYIAGQVASLESLLITQEQKVQPVVTPSEFRKEDPKKV